MNKVNEDTGLVFAYLLKKGVAQALSWEQVRAWKPAQGPLWLHLDYTKEEARKWLFEESGIKAIDGEALIAEESRPRVVATADTFFLILRGVNCNPGADPEDMVSLRLWLEKDRVITMRHQKVMAVEDVLQRIKMNNGPTSVNEFLVMIARRLIDRMGDVISEIDDQVDELEDLVVHANSQAIRPKLTRLRRQSISLRRYIAPQRDVLARLQNEKLPWLTDTDRIHLREISERTARFVDDIDSARDRAAVTQEELSNRLSEQMNKTMYILAIITGIFLPLGLVTGLLGINVGGIPGTQNKYGFAIVCSLIILMALIQYLIFKRRKML